MYWNMNHQLWVIVNKFKTYKSIDTMQFWRVKWADRTGISPTTNSHFTPWRHPLITTCCWHRDRFYIFIENQWCFKFQHFNRVSRKYWNRQVGLGVRRYLAEISLAKVIDEYAGWLQTVFFVWVIFYDSINKRNCSWWSLEQQQFVVRVRVPLYCEHQRAHQQYRHAFYNELHLFQLSQKLLNRHRNAFQRGSHFQTFW